MPGLSVEVCRTLISSPSALEVFPMSWFSTSQKIRGARGREYVFTECSVCFWGGIFSQPFFVRSCHAGKKEITPDRAARVIYVLSAVCLAIARTEAS